MVKIKKNIGILVTGLLISFASFANSVSIEIYSADNQHISLGQVAFKDTPFGLLITPNLTALPTGLHGFHVHQYPSCEEHAMAAGGHFDPKNTNTHQGPYGNGHLGDLPALYVDSNGEAHLPVLAPRIKTSDLKGLSLMIHANGDNYSDKPELGGGGARIACGAFK